MYQYESGLATDVSITSTSVYSHTYIHCSDGKEDQVATVTKKSKQIKNTADMAAAGRETTDSFRKTQMQLVHVQRKKMVTVWERVRKPQQLMKETPNTPRWLGEVLQPR